MKVIQRTLQNGIKAVVIELPGRNIVSSAVFIGAGSRYESRENFGISHFVEHMVFKGTEKYPNYEKIALALERYGGEQNAGTSKDNTYFWNVVNKKYYKEALGVLAQQVGKPLFDEKEIEKEKGVVIEEIHRDNDEPAELGTRKLGELMWPNHPLSCDILGPIENIRKFRREDLANYVKPLYVANNMTIAVAGAVSAEEVFAELESCFSMIPTGVKVIPKPVDMSQDESRVEICHKEIEQAHVFYAFKTVSHNDPRRFALDVLFSLLGKGSGSRLVKIIREEQGLAYAIETFNRYMTDGGFCGVYAGLNVERAPEAVQMIKEELWKAKEKLFTEEELVRAKEYLKGLFHIGNLETTHDIAYYYGRKELLYPEAPFYEERERLIDAVTAEEVRQVAQEMLLSEKENLVVVGPFKNKENFVKMLREIK